MFYSPFNIYEFEVLALRKEEAGQIDKLETDVEQQVDSDGDSGIEDSGSLK